MTRLVTLTGPGGVGKTRLAVVVARAVQERYRDGTVLVACEAVTEPALLMTTLAAALGVRDTGSDPVTAMRRELFRRQQLVLLDNLEQVLDAAPALVELLDALPGLTMLVTSRAPLAVSGEQAFPVLPLEVTTTGAAVALFADRARAARPSFALTAGNTDDVAALCRRLDGLPLAIELVAAQSRTLPPAELLTRLRSPLDAPGPVARDRPPRHHSLRAALDGSYDLLSPVARELFVALSVFVGGFPFAAAEQVCHAGAVSLSELVDASLVRLVSPEAHRFAMLETVRQYAEERRGDATVDRKHASYFLDLAESADADLGGPRQSERLRQLDLEHDNLRAAFGALRAADDAEGELRLAIALARFWYVRGHLAESRTRLSEALVAAETLPTNLRADALRKVSVNAVLRGDYPEAMGLAEQALALYDELGDAIGRARSLSNIGAIAHATGDLHRAGVSLNEAIGLARRIEAQRVVALALNNLGDLCLTLGDFVEATRLFSESRGLLEAQGDAANVARSLLNLALSALGREDDEEAEALVGQSLPLCADLGDREDIAWCLLARSALLVRGGNAGLSAVLLGTAEAVLREIDAVLKPYERSLHAATCAALTEALGEQSFARYRAEGAALSVEDAVTRARP